MIKLGFKIFAIFSVGVFLTCAGLYIAIKTVPPVYEVRQEVKDIVYPTAREHLVRKFDDFLTNIENSPKIDKFTISEIEANAYIYYLLSDKLTIDGIPFIKNPYLFMKPGLLKLRIDLPFENFLQLIKNKRLEDMKLDENLKSLAQAQKSEFTLAVTFLISCYWVKDHPYFYLQKVYLGVLPVPISIFFADYQDQFNKWMWDFYENNFRHLSFFVKKIEVSDKMVKFSTETKITNSVALNAWNHQFKKENPALYDALLSRNCLYGCTKKEWADMQNFYKDMNGYGAADIEMSKIVKAQMMYDVLKKRKIDNREQRIKKMLTPQSVPDQVIYQQDLP
jgi:hypothetical protein